jgi:hypothetical protein
MRIETLASSLETEQELWYCRGGLKKASSHPISAVNIDRVIPWYFARTAKMAIA